MHSRRDVHAWFHNRVFLISALGGMAYILSSSSALPQASQGMGDVSGEQAFNNVCRTCHMVKEGDNRLGPNLRCGCCYSTISTMRRVPWFNQNRAAVDHGTTVS